MPSFSLPESLTDVHDWDTSREQVRRNFEATQSNLEALTVQGQVRYLTISSDADATVGAYSNVRHTGTLTADRALTLSTSGAIAGQERKITRTGTGAFNLSVGGLKNLVTNTWCEVAYDGSAWYLSQYGAL